MQATPEVLRAIETAIQIEKDGLTFYTEAARQTDDPNGKKMFKSLAKDEAAHLKLFQDARKGLIAENKWLAPEQVEAISPRRFGGPQSERPLIFPTADKVKTVEIPEHQLAALRRGIQAEEDSIAFYSKQIAQVDDLDAQAMYAYLIEQEQSHRMILQGEYDYLTRTGFWFDIREFDIESAV
jgi:rubrerythrin